MSESENKSIFSNSMDKIRRILLNNRNINRNNNNLIKYLFIFILFIACFITIIRADDDIRYKDNSKNNTAPVNLTDPSTWGFVGPIRKCPNGTDEDLNRCFKVILSDLRPQLAAGIPAIQLPALDPLILPKLDFKQGNSRGAVVIKAEFMDVKIKGLSNFTKAEFKINRLKRILTFEMLIPRVRIDGIYNLGGNILVFPIGGTGPYWFDVGDVQVHGHLKLKLNNTLADGNKQKKIVAVDDIHLTLDIKTIKIQLLNLFNGNQVLGPVINNVLNENGQELFQEVRPGIIDQISNIVKSIANAVVVNLPFLAEYL